MFLNKIIKRPLLPIGILMAYVVIHDLSERGIINLSKRKEILKATSCRAVLVKLNRRIPKNWNTFCKDNNLTVTIKKDKSKIKKIRIKESNKMADLKGTGTLDNLKAAFAGESQANRRYLYFAKQADVEGYPVIAGNFRETAEGDALASAITHLAVNGEGFQRIFQPLAHLPPQPAKDPEIVEALSLDAPMTHFGAEIYI